MVSLSNAYVTLQEHTVKGAFMYTENEKKITGPSNIMTEMLKASPDECSQLIADLINAIVKEWKVPEE